MPRNRYTRLVREQETAQLAHHEKQLIQLIRQLRRDITESPSVLLLNSVKERRSARLTHNRLHKPHRSLNNDAAGSTPRRHR